jgi:hypothetical protein
MKKMIRGMLRSKTMWFSALLVLLGAISDNSSYIQDLIDPKVYSISMFIIGITMSYLRILTTQPLDQK